MRPDDIAWSDVGAWPSTGDAVADCVCSGCRRRGTHNMIAKDTLCWSCWARRPATEGEEP
jgi:hypothetical protein